MPGHSLIQQLSSLHFGRDAQGALRKSVDLNFATTDFRPCNVCLSLNESPRHETFEYVNHYIDSMLPKYSRENSMDTVNNIEYVGSRTGNHCCCH